VTKKPTKQAANPRKRGSISSYTQEIADKICARISEGEGLKTMCREEGMPGWRTVYDWIQKYPEFAQAMERARELGADAIASECLEIADTPLQGEETTTRPDGSVETKRGDMLGHRKLQIETRLKLLAKWHPKKYGERTTLAGDPEAPLGVSRPLEGVSTEALQKALEKLGVKV
jgi:hypothetical protein